MPVELLIAPPATGKTSFCIERIMTLRRENSLSPVVVVVPDRMQASAFRHRLASAGGALGVKVGRFNDLFGSLLEHSGHQVPLASMPLVHRLIRDGVDGAVANDDIPYLMPLQPFPGFSLVLQDVFAELKRAFISSDRFTQFTQAGTPMQRELARLYSDYQARLETIGWADAGQIPLLAGSLLEENTQAAAWIQLLVVDGFDSLNGSQQHLLKLLSGQTVNLLITFPGARNSPRRAHQRFQAGIEQLIADLKPQMPELPKQTFLPPIAKTIEEHIFDETDVAEKQSAEAPILLEARSPAEEVRETLRWFKKLVVREDIPLPACAIFTPNPETYHPLLRDIAQEFGIPVRFSLDEPLEQSPAISALVNLLALPIQNFRTRQLLNTLRSPYFNIMPKEIPVDTLERISRVARIVEGMEQWDETWDRLENSSELEKQDLADERNAPNLPRGTQAASLRELMDSIFTLLTPPGQVHPQMDWIKWLEDMLEEVRFFEKIESDRDRSAIEAFRDLLRALVLSESMAGSRSLTYEQFFNSLQSLLNGKGYRETGSGYHPALLVGRMQEARGLRFQAVALMGLSEGSFPITERPDPFLDEDLRAALGLEPRLNREQAGLFYQALTRTDEHLLITRPYLTADGEEWEPSVFWKAVENLFEETARTRVKANDDRPLADAASSQELLFGALQRKSLPQQFKFLEERWRHLQHAREILNARKDKEAGSEYEGTLAAAAADLQERYAAGQTWSASGLETYGKCPFFFLVNRALELAEIEPPELGMDARQLGSMLHSILEQTYKEASDPGDVESVLTSLHQVVGSEFSEAPRKYGFRASALWEIEQDHWLEKLEKTVQELTGDGNWTPLAFEAKFGLGDKPFLEVKLDGETIRMRGVIDRVDRNEQGQLRVIDYKTGGTFSKRDLEKGSRLQLPLYALAARDALGLGTPVDGFYWFINAEKSSLKLIKIKTENSSGVDASIDLVKGNMGKFINRIRSSQFPPIKPDGGCPDYCPASLWCWHFERGWRP